MLKPALLLLASLALVGQGVPDRYLNPKNVADPKTVNAFFERIMFAREPFRGSWSEKKQRQTQGYFFTPAEYDKLRGNPALGWIYAGKFTWPEKMRDVEVVPFQGFAAGQNVKADAWRRAAEIVLPRLGLRNVPGAPIKVTGALVGVNYVRPLGVMTEIRIQGPTGTMLLRTATGKATIGDAIGANLEGAIAMARGMGDGRPVSKAEAEAMVRRMLEKAGVKP